MVKEFVISMGYEKEIIWQNDRSFDKIDESSFLQELAWVVLSSGIREKVIRSIFTEISEIFFFWEDPKRIMAEEEKCLVQALKIFNNKLKIQAIITAARRIDEIGFNQLKEEIRNNPLETFSQFPFIGPITAYHLAKNIGIQIAKPDRHLVRIADLNGYTDVQEFCRHVSNLSGDSVSVVDIIFWRFAASCPDYIARLLPYTKIDDVFVNSDKMGCLT